MCGLCAHSSVSPKKTIQYMSDCKGAIVRVGDKVRFSMTPGNDFVSHSHCGVVESLHEHPELKVLYAEIRSDDNPNGGRFQRTTGGITKSI